MAVTKDPKIQNQFTLETLLSEKLSSKYQVSFNSSLLTLVQQGRVMEF